MRSGDADTEFARLKWSCRRGMLELDTLLMPFVETACAELNRTELEAFKRLLQLPDPVLFDYLMGYQDVKEDSLANIVAKIRSIS